MSYGFLRKLRASARARRIGHHPRRRMPCKAKYARLRQAIVPVLAAPAAVAFWRSKNAISGALRNLGYLSSAAQLYGARVM